MADGKLLATLREGVNAWNAWRQGKPRERIALSGADLHMEHLNGANLRGVDLSRADLPWANLDGADLVGANLSRANLASAILTGADLTGANLTAADLRGAKLYGADLCGADLSRADVGRADLRDADLRGATFSMTFIAECDTLRLAKGLEAVRHEGPSSLDHITLRACITGLPDVFLQGVGYTLDEIGYLRALYTTPIQHHSCFLSHASADADFVERLRTDLLAANVNCWHFRHDMQGGRFWRAQIDEAIRVHDKLVLVCSEQSLQRENVVAEVIAAMDREREQHSQKLFPIRLDDYILGDEVLQLADRMMAEGQWPEDWVRYVRRYHIPDFSHWKDHDSYQGEFRKLLRDLKEPPKR